MAYTGRIDLVCLIKGALDQSIFDQTESLNPGQVFQHKSDGFKESEGSSGPNGSNGSIAICSI